MPEVIENVNNEDIITTEHTVPENLRILTEEQIAQVIADSKLVDLRSLRTALLAETDWTQNSDVPQATKDKWATYRQALRDITINYSSLDGVEWPAKPE